MKQPKKLVTILLIEAFATGNVLPTFVADQSLNAVCKYEGTVVYQS